MVPLFDHLDADQAHTYSLVLHSQGLHNRVPREGKHFAITVDDDDALAAHRAVGRYLAENPTQTETPPIRKGDAPGIHLSAIFVALTLLVVHAAIVTSAQPADYIRVFGANARRVLNGEIYRCVTALLLHADAAHLAGNMVALVIFAGSVCRVTGSGVGWLMILACGCLGNLINAAVHETGHLSVGASTAVFGAVGILCALRAVGATGTGHGWKQAALAFGGGVALLAFLGASHRSDVGAHLFGFLCGILPGAGYGLWWHRPPTVRIQFVCGMIAATAPVLAWIWGTAR